MTANQDHRPATTSAAGRPASIAALQVLVLEQQQRIEQQSLFINQILEQIRLARQQHFGLCSERFSLDQMALCFNEAEAATALGEDPESAVDDTIGTVGSACTFRAQRWRRGWCGPASSCSRWSTCFGRNR